MLCDEKMPGTKINLESLIFVIRTFIAGWFMVFNDTYNNISVILWGSVLLVEESGEIYTNIVFILQFRLGSFFVFF